MQKQMELMLVSLTSKKFKPLVEELSTITKNDKLAIGEKVVMQLEAMAPEDDEGHTTHKWLEDNLESLFLFLASNGFSSSVRPDKPAPKATAGRTKAKIEEDLEAAKSKLREMGMSEEEIEKLGKSD